MLKAAAQSGRGQGILRASHSFSGQRGRVRRQRGNALIFALLALIITGLGMAGYVTSKQIEIKTQAGQAEAMVLETLRNAANAAILENISNIQLGLPMVNSTPQSITPVTLPGGELEWQPLVTELATMGYLPQGWNLTNSRLNGGNYSFRIRRAPGCVPTNPFACNIVGVLLLEREIADAGQSDGVIIGPILTRLGPESVVSLPGTADRLTQMSNPSPPPPIDPLLVNPVVVGGVGRAGVVGVRIGNQASALYPFVRINDPRDPNLAGNLTANGDLLIRGASTLQGAVRADGAVTTNSTVTANGAVTVNNAPLTVANAAGVNCTTISPTGITVNCAGSVNVTGGNVTANDITAVGAVNAVGDITSNQSLRAQNVQFSQTVLEGQACSPNSVAGLSGGGLAVCGPTRTYRAAMRYGVTGAPCAPAGGPAVAPGVIAVDSNTAEGLVCRQNVWAPVRSMLSNFVLMATTSVVNGSIVTMPSCLNAGSSQPLLFLIPANEAAGVGPGLRHSAFVVPGSARAAAAGYNVGGAWEVELTDYAGRPTAGGLPPNNAIAMTYCYYP